MENKNQKYILDENGIVCPCCLKTKIALNKISRFIDQLESLKPQSYYMDNQSVYFVTAKKFKTEEDYLEIKWACNECLGRKKALISTTITTQREGNTAPVFAFFDFKSSCAKCHKDFIFKKEEWKYWIDELNFYYQTTKKYCERCYPIEKLKKCLSSNISELEAKSFGQEYVDLALEVSEIYLKLNNREKSKGYLKSIINKFKSDDNALLKDRIKDAYNRI